MPDSHKSIENKGLTEPAESSLQTSLQKVSENQPKTTENLPQELLAIVNVWPELPEHIRAAVMALIQTVKRVEKS